MEFIGGEREQVGCTQGMGNVEDMINYEGVLVSYFEDSAEKFMATIEIISSLCGFRGETLDQQELQRLSSTMKFLKEWRYFLSEPKAVSFVHDSLSGQLEEDIRRTDLPQFSSAAIPERGQPLDAAKKVDRKDFVLQAGGLVWALDWCPRRDPVLQSPRCEYLAVSAHPFGSSYHNIGAQLTGRGIIQIWCILHYDRQGSKENPSNRWFRGPGGLCNNSKVATKSRGRPRKTEPDDGQSSKDEPIKDTLISSGGLCSGSKFPQISKRRTRESPLSLVPFEVKTNLDCKEQCFEESLTMGSLASPGGLFSNSKVAQKPRERPSESPLSLVSFAVDRNPDNSNQFSEGIPTEASIRNPGLCSESQFPKRFKERPRKFPHSLVPLDVKTNLDQVKKCFEKRPAEESVKTPGGPCNDSKVVNKPRGRPRKSSISLMPFKGKTNLDNGNQCWEERPTEESVRSPGDSCSNSKVVKKPGGEPRKSTLSLVPLEVKSKFDYVKQCSEGRTSEGSLRTPGDLCSVPNVEKPRGRPRKSPVSLVLLKGKPNFDDGKQCSEGTTTEESFRISGGLCDGYKVSQRSSRRPRKIPQYLASFVIETNIDYGNQCSEDRPTEGSLRSPGSLCNDSKIVKNPFSLVPVEDLNDGPDFPMKRGRSMKASILPESVNDLSGESCIMPSMWLQGRPRKILHGEETADRKAEDIEPNQGLSTSPGRHKDAISREDHVITSLNHKTMLKPCKKRRGPKKVSDRMDDTFGSPIEYPRNADKHSNVGATDTFTVLSPLKMSSQATESCILTAEASSINKYLEESELGLLQPLSVDYVSKLVYPGQKELPSDASIDGKSYLAEDMEMHWTNGMANAYSQVFQEYQTKDGTLEMNIRSSDQEENSKATVIQKIRENENLCNYPISTVGDVTADRYTQTTEVIYEDEVTVSHEIICLDDGACSSIKEDIALPRVVLCLGHNGKVAWDVKWRPCAVTDEFSGHRLGYLAAVLGNGSLEVWEIPTPNVLRNIFMSTLEDGTDPRFVKLRPVFKCSEIKCGSRQSIPLTLEWSKPEPDLILVGCHDGTVALWKFYAGDSSQDTKPLLCFTADNVPIRAVCWAPGESGSRRSNIFVTAGHEGLKFWDLRDPYRPLWDFLPAQKVILSLDWLLHPSCLVIAFDDGTIRTLSLSKAACNVHITGKPFEGAKHGVFHTYYRSQFAIWSVHASPVTGMAAYCCADGSTFYSQITENSVEKDKSRNRLAHYLCGNLLQGSDPHSLTVKTPLPYTATPDLPRRARGVPPPSKAQNPKKEGELGGGLETSGSNTSEKAQKSRKKTDNKIQEAAVGTNEQENDVEFLAFPPKSVAMHRVRWNTNPGSERWLCSGGAAGIVRCQLIDFQHP